MSDYPKLAGLGLPAFLAAMAADCARDAADMVPAILVLLLAAGAFLWTLRAMPADGRGPAPRPAPAGYMDGPIRAGVIATGLWGVVGFLVGTWIAFQLAFPALNIEWPQPYANLGRLRPIHTSAVIFAFGGNALIAASLYAVQRTCGARLWGGNAA